MAQEQLQEQSENKLHIERSKAAVTLEAIGEGVITTDTEGTITYMNPAAEMLTGTKIDSVKGNVIHDILRIRENDSAHISNYPIEKVLNNKESVRHESHLILVKPDNSELVIKDIASPVFDMSGELIGMVLVFYDFSNIKRMSDKLSYQASHDDLTDLYNRREFEDQLDDALKDARERNTEHALCYLDLDQFKIINDTCGHMAGDILLKQISHQIKTKVRRHDLLARLGGDEFGIIFYDTPIKKAKLFAKTIKDSVSGYKYIWNDSTFEVGVSIGLVPINANVRSHSELMMRADSACYIAKDNGRNCIHTYAASDVDFIRRSDELHWYNKINEAIENDKFTLYYQKIMPTKQSTQKGIHYEILLRMEDIDRQITPAEFISAAERYLLMPKIDRWVLESFLKGFENREIDNFGGDRYNINLSGQSLCNDEFLDFAMQRLQGKYVSPSRLTFEITETAAISNMDKALQFILHLKELGCKFALDDFGTGVSSFQYLHDLPVDYLKIDGKFVRNIDSNRINRSIIDSISKIGHELGLEIIAEYVEDDQIRDKLLKCDVDYLQGYAIGYPTPLKELLKELP
jgi:diguanylate cyclase (GGDEF)-like protein/PAS domain S-box-containing protein